MRQVARQHAPMTSLTIANSIHKQELIFWYAVTISLQVNMITTNLSLIPYISLLQTVQMSISFLCHKFS